MLIVCLIQNKIYCLFVRIHQSTDCNPLINVGSILTNNVDTRRSYISNSLFTHDISESVIIVNNHKGYHEKEQLSVNVSVVTMSEHLVEGYD